MGQALTLREDLAALLGQDPRLAPYNTKEVARSLERANGSKLEALRDIIRKGGRSDKVMALRTLGDFALAILAKKGSPATEDMLKQELDTIKREYQARTRSVGTKQASNVRIYLQGVLKRGTLFRSISDKEEVVVLWDSCMEGNQSLVRKATGEMAFEDLKSGVSGWKRVLPAKQDKEVSQVRGNSEDEDSDHIYR